MTNDLSSTFQPQEHAMTFDRPQRVEPTVARRTPRPTAEAAAEQMEYLVQQLTNLMEDREGRIVHATTAANDADAPAPAKPGMFARIFRG
jgi:hypothetical protein